MLTITSLGNGGFRITGGERPVIAFPPDGVKAAVAGSLTLLPHPEENAPDGVISWPGEYNEGGVTVRGIGHDEGQQISYVVTADGVRSGLLSTPLKDWSDKQIESAPDIDVLVIPSGDTKLVQKLVDEFDPRVLILVPVGDKNNVDSLSKTLGVKETTKEYKVKSLPAEGREVVLLG